MTVLDLLFCVDRRWICGGEVSLRPVDGCQAHLPGLYTKSPGTNPGLPPDEIRIFAHFKMIRFKIIFEFGVKIFIINLICNKLLGHLQPSAPIAVSSNTPELSPADAAPRSSVPKAHGSKRIVSALDDNAKVALVRRKHKSMQGLHVFYNSNLCGFLC